MIRVIHRTKKQESVNLNMAETDVTPLRKHSGKRMFPLANTLRFFMFPSSFSGPWYENI